MSSTFQRGDGVGIECTHELLRGVRLSHEQPGSATAAAEVPVLDIDDDRSTLDAFARLRAELGDVGAPSRLALFPAGSSMRRIDVTGLTGPELNRVRSGLDRDFDISTTLLVDAGPRRWMHVIQWDTARLRRLEQIAERAGFVDVTIDPSPVALARVVAGSTTFARRHAATGTSFTMALDGIVPIAAASDDALGTIHPDLRLGEDPVSAAFFDGLVDPGQIADQLALVDNDQSDVSIHLHLGPKQYATFPPSDVRAAERQCVSLGAAVGAAGLAGPLRPVDIINDVGAPGPRPWAIERTASLDLGDAPTGPGPIQRLGSILRRPR